MPIDLGPDAARTLDLVSKYVSEILNLVSGGEEDLERLKLQTETIELLRNAGYLVSEQRRTTAVALNQAGVSYARLADELDVSRGRIQQLITGVGAPRRSGVIETEMRVAAAEMRAGGATDSELLDVLVPRIRAYKSGDRLTTGQIARMLSIDEGEVVPVVEKVDAEIRKTRLVSRET